MVYLDEGISSVTFVACSFHVDKTHFWEPQESDSVFQINLASHVFPSVIH